MPGQRRTISPDGLLVDVGLSLPQPFSKGVTQFPALVDTGAQATLILRTAADSVGLKGTGPCTIVPAGGRAIDSEQLRLSVCLKEQAGDGHPDNQMVFSRLIALNEAAIYPHRGPPLTYSVLLGMDFIRHCILHIEDNRFEMSVNSKLSRALI